MGSVMDDWPIGFIKDKLKTTFILFLLFFFIPTATAESDFLLEIMQDSWSNYDQKEANYNKVNECYCGDQNSDFEDPDFGNSENGHHDSWDNLYLDKYESLEIIINPYE